MGWASQKDFGEPLGLLGNRCTNNGLQAGLQTPGWARCCPRTTQLMESSREIWESGQWETRTCTADTQS